MRPPFMRVIRHLRGQVAARLQWMPPWVSLTLYAVLLTVAGAAMVALYTMLNPCPSFP